MTDDAPAENPDPSSRSRENSLQHGLTGDGVVLPADMGQEVADRRDQYAEVYQPRTLDDHDLIHQAALGIVRFNRLQPMYSRRAAFRSRQATTHWPLLRTVEAIERSKRLPYDPPSVVAQMRTNIGGVEWLLQEWRLLLLALNSTGDWTPRQVERAQNLAGVPRVHRHLDPEKVRDGPIEVRRALVDRQIADLERLRHDEELARLDEEERQGIIQQLDDFQDPAHDRLHRYEQRALRLHKNAIQELGRRLASRLDADSDDSGPTDDDDEPIEPANPTGPVPAVDRPASPPPPVSPVFSPNHTRPQPSTTATRPGPTKPTPQTGPPTIAVLRDYVLHTQPGRMSAAQPAAPRRETPPGNDRNKADHDRKNKRKAQARARKRHR